MSNRDDLIQAAWDYEADIAMAAFLHSMTAASGPTPADVITWICRLEPDKMIAEAELVGKVNDQLGKVDQTQIQELYKDYDPAWSGKAGTAFSNRWQNDLLTYVGGDDTSARRGDFTKTKDMMIAVASNADLLQGNCKTYITEHLKGLRSQFEKAVQADEEAEDLQDIQADTQLAIDGVAILVGTQSIGDAVGSGLKSVVTRMFNFMNNTVTDAQDSLGAAVAEKAMSLEGKTESLEDFHVIAYKAYEPEEP